MRRILLAGTFALAIMVLAGSVGVHGRISEAQPRLPLVASFEGGHLYQAGRFRVLQLNGTWRQMGRQYGTLMAADLRGMHDEIISQYAKHPPTPTDDTLQHFSLRVFGLYPERFQEMARGMVETSHVSWEDLAVINGFFDYFLYSGSPQFKHCSAVAAWKPYTGNGPLVMGRNFDFPTYFQNFHPYLTVVVYNPSDAANPTAIITWAGQIGSIQAFNARGLVLENNDGSSCGDPVRHFGERVPFLANDVTMLLDHGTFEGLDAALKTSRLPYPLVFNVASPQGAWCYEMSTTEVRRRQGLSDGLLVGVNHFLSPGWPTSPKGSKESLESSSLRHGNLCRLAEQRKGTFTADSMMQMFDVQMDQGGGTPGDHNVYQFVVVPAELTLYLKAAGYADWTRIDLGPFFRGPASGR